MQYWRAQDKHRAYEKDMVTPHMERLKDLGLVEEQRGLWQLTYKGKEVLAEPE